MRIDINLGAMAELQNQGAARASARSRTPEQTAEPQDVAELSCDGISISDLTAKALAAPEIRAEKVSGLRQQIAEGTYQPNASRIASAMIENLLAR